MTIEELGRSVRKTKQCSKSLDDGGLDWSPGGKMWLDLDTF